MYIYIYVYIYTYMYDLAGTRTHDPLCERWTRLPLSQPDTVLLS